MRLRRGTPIHGDRLHGAIHVFEAVFNDSAAPDIVSDGLTHSRARLTPLFRIRLQGHAVSHGMVQSGGRGNARLVNDTTALIVANGGSRQGAWASQGVNWGQPILNPDSKCLAPIGRGF